MKKSSIVLSFKAKITRSHDTYMVSIPKHLFIHKKLSQGDVVDVKIM